MYYLYHVNVIFLSSELQRLLMSMSGRKKISLGRQNFKSSELHLQSLQHLDCSSELLTSDLQSLVSLTAYPRPTSEPSEIGLLLFIRTCVAQKRNLSSSNDLATPFIRGRTCDTSESFCTWFFRSLVLLQS